jgi:hypothetical protein
MTPRAAAAMLTGIRWSSAHFAAIITTPPVATTMPVAAAPWSLLGDFADGVGSTVATGFGGGVVAPPAKIVGSSAFMARIRPAQPSCRSMTFAS